MQELDVRVLPPQQKHSTIHQRLEHLDLGDTLRIINDHDPRPLRYEIDDEYPDHFTWTYLESGPHVWRIDIVKKQNIVPEPESCLLADSPALRVAEIRVAAGSRTIFEKLGGTAALLFDRGEGSITISGRSHVVQPGSVELVCPGELGVVAATTDIHAYIAIAKDRE